MATETEARIRRALRLYQDAATDETIAYFAAPGDVCDAHLIRRGWLDDAALEIRTALGQHMADGSDPAQLIASFARYSGDAARAAWLSAVADDIAARLRGEDPPLPSPPH